MSADPLDVSALDERLAPVVCGRRVIVASTVAAVTAELVAQLVRYGAQRPLVLAADRAQPTVRRRSYHDRPGPRRVPVAGSSRPLSSLGSTPGSPPADWRRDC